MDLTKEYLENVQKIDGIWVLSVPDEVTEEEKHHFYLSWEDNWPGETLMIIPQSFKIHKLNKYSFYTALMLVHAGKRITRLDWIKEVEYKKEDAPYLCIDDIAGQEMLVRKWPGKPDEDEFFIIGKDDMDLENYVLAI